MYELGLVNKLIIHDDTGQSSAEMILLIGTILVIVLLVSSYVTSISKSINGELKGLIENGRDYIINKI
jgi:uncharacterized protein (UPF0333 family)